MEDQGEVPASGFGYQCDVSLSYVTSNAFFPCLCACSQDEHDHVLSVLINLIRSVRIGVLMLLRGRRPEGRREARGVSSSAGRQRRDESRSLEVFRTHTREREIFRGRLMALKDGNGVVIYTSTDNSRSE